jgi:hypothetical protein
VAPPFDYERYQDYIRNSPIWKLKRKTCLQYWQYQCALNDKHAGPMDVHHRTYERLYDEPQADLIPLCPACHQLFQDAVIECELTPRPVRARPAS